VAPAWHHIVSSSVLLGLLEGLAQVRLGLAGELGHDFRAVDQEEEGARLVGHGAREPAG